MRQNNQDTEVSMAALAAVLVLLLQAPQADDKKIQDLVAKCASEDISEREAATRELFALGEAAVPALEKAFAVPGPVVVDVVVDRDELCLPMVPAGGANKDMILERPNKEAKAKASKSQTGF